MFPLFHITFGFMKKSVVASDKIKTPLKYVQNKFRGINEAKIKESLFAGPQTRKLVLDETFNRVLRVKEKKKLWKAIKSVAINFKGNVKADN